MSPDVSQAERDAIEAFEAWAAGTAGTVKPPRPRPHPAAVPPPQRHPALRRGATKNRERPPAGAAPRVYGKPDLQTAAAGVLHAYEIFRVSGNLDCLHGPMAALRDALEPGKAGAGQHGQVLAALCEAPGSSVVLLTRKTGIHEAQLRRVLNALAASGLVTRSRQPRSKTWDWHATPLGEEVASRPSR